MKHFIIFAMFISIAALTAQPAIFSGGTGVSGDPYLISNTTDLTSLASYTTLGNNYCSGMYFRQTGNIDYAGGSLTPIGTIKGNYDGAGYKISNFTITSSSDYVGVFKLVDGATAVIQNLGITGATINSTGTFNTAALVGLASGGATITKCYVTGCTVTGVDRVGSLVGWCGLATISLCYASGGTVSGSYHVGGLIGYVEDIPSISNCYSSVGVTSSNGYRGGLVGNLFGGTITNCYSSGIIGTSGSNIGGLVGTVSGTITNSFWDNTVNTVSNARGTGKTTTEMKTSNTFTVPGWNFSTIWEMIGTNYPRLKANAESALPVELASFTAEIAEKSVELKWRTATEVNNYGFEIQRSAISTQQSDNVWLKIGFVEGNGTTNAPKSYSFTDKSASGKTSYRLKQIDRDGKFEYSRTVEVTAVSAPKEFGLEQNYPNPFNPTTAIGYQLLANGFTSLKVYDALGREVATLVNEAKEAGTYSVQFDGAKLSSGIYFARLTSSGKTQMRKLLMMK